MDVVLKKSKVKRQKTRVKITGSKSETNRLLLLQALYPNIKLENTSKSDDSDVMMKVLSEFQFPSSVILSLSKCQFFNVHHAGTAMRFLTAYFAIQEGREVVLTGSSRMKERPIRILVEALQQLGAAISYEEKEGFPPLRIKGKKITQNRVSLKADVSSQYISALLLIAPKLENGLELTLEGEITSLPYINMTLALLNEMDVEANYENNVITVKPKFKIQNSKFIIESDWSSASYFYSIVALSEIGTQIQLSSYKQNSLQGDAALVEIYKQFGVETVFQENSILIRKIEIHNSQFITHNLKNCPDIAQTIAVTCFGLGLGCHLTGLHTLKIKETDRLEALKTELTQLGATISITNDSLTIEQSNNPIIESSIATYQDHRMAMAFAPLTLKTPIKIQDAEVVSKSFPTFWEDLQSIGFEIVSL